jgi:hypothetical protein
MGGRFCPLIAVITKEEETVFTLFISRSINPYTWLLGQKIKGGPPIQGSKSTFIAKSQGTPRPQVGINRALKAVLKISTPTRQTDRDLICI